MNKKYFILALLFFAFFGLFTLGVCNYDRQPIGPQESIVGFASWNGAFHNRFPNGRLWYTLSKLCLLPALGSVVFYALLGVKQLCLTRRFSGVSPSLRLLGGFYILIAGCYLFFEKVTINLRPVLEEDGRLEPSYPSTHTLLALCLYGGSLLVCKYWMKHNAIPIFTRIVSGIHLLLLCCVVVGRLFSGVHWLTDIIGAILLSVALCLLLKTFLPRKTILGK